MDREVIDENDDKLRELRDEYGDEVFKDVETAMLQLNEYNPSGKYHVPILWSFKEVTQATLEESSQAAVNQLIPPSRGNSSKSYARLLKIMVWSISPHWIFRYLRECACCFQ
ncbi:factor of DNA methylation 3-like [Amborella trichopoda]|uniref:factor of DNA methylation 3-like n=1 Tax=Amborella trichopoda TaxID=13333 RepID=UPI0009C0066F|nr:factor of DNA methylation 3-like [Amborella trichopoda]|eukprot:XP_020522163.1 factor of DNA methylation 3-like [Amborella trichopoda]